MNTCPHCSAPTISAFRKAMATPFSPAICGNCDKASYVSTWSGVLAMLVAEAVMLVGIVAAILSGSLYGLLAIPLGVVVMMVLLAWIFPLVPARQEVRDTRRSIVRRTGVLVVLVAIASATAIFAAAR
jgi:hypothetical protein